MKKIKILLLLCIPFLLSGCFLIYKDFNLIVTEIKGDDCEPVFITDDIGRKIYSYCLKDISLKMENNTIHPLEEAIRDGKVTVSDLFTVLEVTDTLWDGGTTIYEGEKYKIFACQNMSGNNDVFIARKDVLFDASLCEKKAE